MQPSDNHNRTSLNGGRGLSRGATLIFAIAAGLSVANIYYAQPLLDLMARDLEISPSAIGLVVAMTQIGYALGLIFIVPLGDLVNRRRLIIGQGILSVASLVAVGTASTKVILFVSLVLMGVLSVLVQILVAFAAASAAPSERGRVVGVVTSGVVTGILAARFIAGVLADFGGWRAVYLASAMLTAWMVVLLMRVLPQQCSTSPAEGYVDARRSIPVLFRRDRILLVRGTLALLIFATFSAFWTALVMPLSAPPLLYSHTQIGLFGLLGMAGAIAATGAGRLADRGLGHLTTGISLALLLASWGLIAMLPTTVLPIFAGIVLLDMAVQAIHVTNQSIILNRYPEASSRLVGGYMVFYSIGSAMGGISSTLAYAHTGWSGVSMIGAGFSGVALLFWLVTRRDFCSPIACSGCPMS